MNISAPQAFSLCVSNTYWFLCSFAGNHYSQIDGILGILGPYMDGVEPADLNQCFEQCDNIDNCDGFNYYPPGASTLYGLRCTFWS